MHSAKVHTFLHSAKYLCEKMRFDHFLGSLQDRPFVKSCDTIMEGLSVKISTISNSIGNRKKDEPQVKKTCDFFYFKS